MTVYRLGAATVTVSEHYTITRFDDGGEVVADHAPQPGQADIAARLGISVAAMNAGHDLGHSLIAVLMGLDRSPTLHAVAHGRVWPHWHREEAAVLSAQALAASLGLTIADLAAQYVQIRESDMTKLHRSAVTGQFVTAEDAAADPERHVAEAVRERPVMRVERMNEHFVKIHLGDGRVLHHFSGADGPDADFHDHPFAADIVVQVGGYLEQILSLDRPHDPPQEIERREGDRFRNEAGTIHRIVRLTAPFVITEFCPGPHERTSGFYQQRPDGIRHRLWHENEWRSL